MQGNSPPVLGLDTQAEKLATETWPACKAFQDHGSQTGSNPCPCSANVESSPLGRRKLPAWVLAEGLGDGVGEVEDPWRRKRSSDRPC